jgi:hypothetical protein
MNNLKRKQMIKRLSHLVYTKNWNIAKLLGSLNQVSLDYLCGEGVMMMGVVVYNVSCFLYISQKRLAVNTILTAIHTSSR